MGDHFVLLVDRLLTESTLEDAIQSKNRLLHPLSPISEEMTTSFSFHRMDHNIGSSPLKSEECRICHDEDEDLNMDIPCSCRGSLKFAHPECVQRWCNEKGDTTCEICHQQFKPCYTSPPPLFHYGGVPMSFRENWEIGRRDLHAPQFISMVSTNESFLESDFDEYPVQTSRGLICCRIVAVTFMVLLVLRHTLPVLLYGAGEYSISLFMLLMLRTCGILLPIYIMVKMMTALQRRRNRQGLQGSRISSVATSDGENELPQMQPESHLIRVP